MGMYTEIVIKACMKENLPEEVSKVLDYMFRGGEKPDIYLPSHSFFKCPRWDFIGKGSSYYHVPASITFYDEGYLFSRSDLKNYDDEINLFFDWINPYLEGLSGQCIGYLWYEEDTEPTLIYKR